MANAVDHSPEMEVTPRGLVCPFTHPKLRISERPISKPIMRSTVVSVIAAVSSLLAVGAGVASASPAGQLPNLAQSVVDWTAQEVSALGDDGTVHAQNGWQFIDCGASLRLLLSSRHRD